MKKDKQQPEKGQLTNEEYLDLYGSKDNMYLKARISTNEYFKLPEDKRRFYVRFCGLNEVFYTLNPMTSPFSVTIPKVEDQAPLSNETKVVENMSENETISYCPYCNNDCNSMNHIEDCQFGYLNFINTSPDFESLEDNLRNTLFIRPYDLKNIESAAIKLCDAQPFIKLLSYNKGYLAASQFKNTDAVKVITYRIAELRAKSIFEQDHNMAYFKEVNELNHILKLIQP